MNFISKTATYAVLCRYITCWICKITTDCLLAVMGGRVAFAGCAEDDSMDIVYDGPAAAGVALPDGVQALV